MKKILVLLSLSLLAAACTDNREAMISEKLKGDVEAGITKSLGKSEFTDGYVSHFVKNMKLKLQGYDEATKVATVEITSMNKGAQDGLVMAAMLTSGKLPFSQVVELYEKDTKRSLASLESNVSVVKCQIEEKEGKEIVKSCK